MSQITRNDARAILESCNAFGNFFTLPRSTVESLLEHADARRYRKPKHANGSRGRYFHAYLMRRASGGGISAAEYSRLLIAPKPGKSPHIGDT